MVPEGISEDTETFLKTPLRECDPMADKEETEVERMVREVREATVTYTVRDLLFRIEERLIRVEDRSSNYATKEDVVTAGAKHEKEYKALSERHEAQYRELSKELDELKSIRDKMLGYIAAVMTVGALSGGTAGYLINNLPIGG